MTDLQRLREKLCRELSQSERDASLHTTREARRLGDIPPARALLAIADHARSLRPAFDALITTAQPVGVRVGRLVGHLFSALRHFLFDRMIDTERSYRGTLLGLRHGVDITRLLREVALREGDARLVHFCDELLVERLGLLEHAEQALAWFADEPTHALASGAQTALEPKAAPAPGAAR